MPDGEQTSLTAFQFLRKLAPYFAAHKFSVALVLLACSMETGFYWVIPLSFRYLVDHALTVADRRSLIRVLIVLATGNVIASVASLWRGRIFGRGGEKGGGGFWVWGFPPIKRGLDMYFFSRAGGGGVVVGSQG